MNGAIISIPVSRRTLLKTYLSLSSAGALMRPLSGQTSTASYYKAIFDERFAEARAFAAGAAARHIATAAIRGDVTRLFFDELDLRWKRGPVTLIGYTLPASLFCLDLLARDRGMRLTHCLAQPSVEVVLCAIDSALPRRCETTHTSSSDPSAPVFWIIEPRARS